MIEVRKSEERGHLDHGWLNTYHTFAFGGYQDPNFMGFRSLRVINEDRVQPGQGFGTHPHRDMEIISYVLEGALRHEDSMGNGSVIRPGDVQRMTAGTGVMHSEFNPSDTEIAHFLQIWIIPNRKGLEPGYEQIHFSRDDKLRKLRLIASPNGRDGSVMINQDASVYATILEPSDSVTLTIAKDRHIWIHVASGLIRLGDQMLSSGDGAGISDHKSIELAGVEESEVLIFDMP